MTDAHSTPHRHDGEQRPGDVLGGRYELQQEIGSGASAITWRARDGRLDRVVAVKVLRRTYAQDPTFAQRFEREARTAASLSHGNVVDVYDVGLDGDVLYLVMQYIDGEDLKHLIRRRGTLGVDGSREIAIQVLAGLGAIHAAGIIHRDIKPQNVLIGRDGVARLTDFGVAQVAVDVGLTTAGTTVGTAAYMAPEQARAETLSEATDLYSVGVMLYEMLTGRLPFNAPTPMALMLAHIQQDVVPPSQADPALGIPPVYDGIVQQAMAKSPQDRFRSAAAMSRALVNAATSQGSSARTVVTPAATAAATRVAPAARATTRGPQSGAWPTPSAPATDLDWARQSTSRRAQSAGGGAMRGILWGFLILVVLMLGAIGVYAYNEYVGDEDDPTTPTRTPSVDVTETSEATDEDEPTATDEDVIAPPIEETDPTEEPTDEPEPTAEPTDEPTSEPTDEPTDEPTVEPTDEPTEEIEPTEEEVPTIGPDARETPAG